MKKKSMSPGFYIFYSFILIIVIGTILLKLPISIAENHTLSWIDALFISTSAVCVTGLVSVSSVAENFTVFGKIVIALLIQVGGLGFVTLAVFFLAMLGVRIGMSERFLIKEALNQKNLSGLIRLVKTIVITTFTIEFIGFVFNMLVFYKDFPFWAAIGYSAFHAISSFNNAGFDLFGNTSIIAYQNNILLNINTSLMIILGGLGFIVLHDLKHKRKWAKLTIHSKIVIKVTLTLIIGGTLLIKLIEQDNITWMQAYFQSVTTRTAGFNTIDFSLISNVTILLFMIMMFIGASPGSTGGGIKTTTVYTMFKSVLSFMKGKRTLTYNRKITDEIKLRAFILAFLAFTGIITISLIILAIEEHNPLYEASLTTILFETTSAFGTVGLSLGITPKLMPASKVVLSLMMFFGRLGPLTIFSLWNRNANKAGESSIEYVSENIIIG